MVAPNLETTETAAIDAWVGFLDVFGFSAQVDGTGLPPTPKGNKLPNVFSRLSSAQHCLRRELAGRFSPLVHSFSDSTFVVYEIPKHVDACSVLIACYEDLQRAQRIFLDHSLPLRGGVARGKVWADESSIVGMPVLKAVEYERLVNYPVVLIPRKELPTPEASADLDLLDFEKRVIPVAVRDDQTLDAVIVYSEDHAHFREYVRRCMSDCLHTGPFDVATVWKKTLELLDRMNPYDGDEGL